MKKIYTSIDTTKFILSLLIVTLHLNPFGERLGWIRFPITRIAVPIFFIISSFLLFNKITAVDTNQEKKQMLFRFVKRNLQLYLAWFIVLFPLTAYNRGYFQNGIVYFFKDVITHLFLGSTFSASWYIMALIIGTLITFYLSKYIKNIGILIIGLLLYTLCCLATNYRYLLQDSNIIIAFLNFYPVNIYLSFPVSIIWISIGKIMAEHSRLLNEISMSKKIVAAGIGLVLLFVEHLIVWKYNLSDANDCYFALLLLSPLLFSVVLSINCKNSIYAKKLRTISTVMYCSHLAVGQVLGLILKKVGCDTKAFSGALILFLLVVLCCGLIAILVDKLKKYRYLKWLQYFQ